MHAGNCGRSLPSVYSVGTYGQCLNDYPAQLQLESQDQDVTPSLSSGDRLMASFRVWSTVPKTNKMPKVPVIFQ